ncbi:hypothetical protein [Pseudonocardia sp.]|uniref:hypothetical protein n=1 Tax=Pseudonocardia sp. TaxID=60912 RepID=UPI0031FCFFC8
MLSYASPRVDSAPADANGASLLGLWSDDSLYQGSMEGNRVAFLAGGTGWFEHANALAAELERFTWEHLAAGRIRMRFTRYLYLENGHPAKVEEHWHSDPMVITARVGRGTDALNRAVTVLTLEDPPQPDHRYALVRRNVQDTDDPAIHHD